jgi:hypothetical protein
MGVESGEIRWVSSRPLSVWGRVTSFQEAQATKKKKHSESGQRWQRTIPAIEAGNGGILDLDISEFPLKHLSFLH